MFILNSKLIPNENESGGFISLTICPHCKKQIKYRISKLDRYFNLLIFGPTALYVFVYRYLNMPERTHMFTAIALVLYCVTITIYSITKRNSQICFEKHE